MPDSEPTASKKALVWACGAALAAAALLAYEIYFPHAASAEPRRVAIAKGMGSRMIGAFLKQEGVIRSKWAFVTYVSLKGIASSLKPGTYTFAQHAIPEIARNLVAGGNDEREITIPEGWKSSDIARYLERQGIGTADAWHDAVSPEAAREAAAQFDFLADAPPDAGLEGYLFPDTYRLPEGADPAAVRLKMLETFGRRVDAALRQDIAQQDRTLFEVVVMASLIEKEVVSDEDRAIVSGILWKRRAAGMPLQVDATVIYATTHDKRTMTNERRTSRISLEETKIDSPYNTYRHRGLPPGPIANPGLSAIRAAAYPKSSPYLYYLSAPDGRTIFSRLLEEHNAAKEQYLK